ncbi:hypothetical protein [Microbispora sp. NPDC049125]|uniref:hypothetical protein n=1 Tax=Microbispora sp. NPDC049125 TaxID=3154929 RepID=UPI003465A206
MLVAAAVCPHPPLIVPEVAGTAAPELDDLRTACVRAIRLLAASGAGVLVVVGGAEKTARYTGDAAGTMRPWGPDVRVGHGDPCLPLSLTVGRWLLELAGVAGEPAGGAAPGTELRFHAVAADASPAECAAIGREIARSADRVAVLAMGDGSARLTESSPGYLHPLAVPYDRMLADAIGSAAVDRLAAMDPAEAAELWVAGRAAFQVLAAAAGDRPRRAAAPGPVAVRRFSEVLYDDAPYGVGYHVARWAFEDASPA